MKNTCYQEFLFGSRVHGFFFMIEYGNRLSFLVLHLLILLVLRHPDCRCLAFPKLFNLSIAAFFVSIAKFLWSLLLYVLQHPYVYGVLVFEAMATFVGQISVLSLIAIFGAAATAMVYPLSHPLWIAVNSAFYPPHFDSWQCLVSEYPDWKPNEPLNCLLNGM